VPAVGSPTESLNADGVLEVGETWTYSYDYTVTQDDINNDGGGDGDIDNTATADTDQTDPVDDSVAVPIDIAPTGPLGIISFAILSVTAGSGNQIDEDALATGPGSQPRMFAIVGDGDQSLETDEAGFTLGQELPGQILNNNPDTGPNADVVFVTGWGPNNANNNTTGARTNQATFTNSVGFGIEDPVTGGDDPGTWLNSGESLTFNLTDLAFTMPDLTPISDNKLMKAEFVMNAANGTSAELWLDFDGNILTHSGSGDGATYVPDGYYVGTFNDGDLVVIDFLNQTITVGASNITEVFLNGGATGTSLADFFALGDGETITIGSMGTSSIANTGFAIQDLKLYFVDQLDPIVLDLGAPGIDLSATALFDINSDGQLDQIAWPDGQDGILVMDLDHSGKIENGAEVFSPYFGAGGFKDALDALSSLDLNGDGIIDAQDAAFADLRVWVDANQDGVSQDGELFGLNDLEIASIDLNAQPAGYQIDGQTVFAEGQYTLSSGESRPYVAVDLKQQDLGGSDPIASGGETIVGGDGDDILLSLGGGNILYGGPGSDTFVLAGLDAADLIADYNLAEGDTVDLSALFTVDTSGGGSVDYLSDFVQVVQNGAGIDDELQVDADGGADTWTTVASLNADAGVTILYNDDGAELTATLV